MATRKSITAAPEIEALISLLAKVPGLGPRSARRAALQLLKKKDALMLPLAAALSEAAVKVRACSNCGMLDAADPCTLCTTPDRDNAILCVVAEVGDVWALERAGAFKGRYHVLGGVLSALDGVRPDDLRIAKLVDRAGAGGVREVILALSATVDGQTTSHYLTERLQPLGVIVSRLSHGVPVGGELDLLDDGTLFAALQSRRPVLMRVGDYVRRVDGSAFAGLADQAPWAWTSTAPLLVGDALRAQGVLGDIFVHADAKIEEGAILQPPLMVGPGCFVASSALLRGGCWLERDCTIGPHCELKSSFIFAGSKLAHLNFVGDSVIGADVNIEAGAIIANYRNERADKRIRIRLGSELWDTGVDKFGALVGDGVRIGANAVIAPGAILAPGMVIPRLGLIDQS